MNEYIICAAIWFQDNKKYKHQPINIETGFVICGRRHHNCYISIAIINDKSFETYKHVKNVQGFLTSTDRFVDRKEGMDIALKANQVVNYYHSDTLYSEDLY